MTSLIAHAALVAAEGSLITHIRRHAELISQAGNRIPDDWKYESSFHMLLALSRRFTPAPHPKGMIGMPEGACYSNSAQYARDHQDQGLAYAEGFALTAEDGCYVPHAWTVRPDGTVLDPTWDDDPRRAYIGIPVADTSLWPFDGRGIVHDFHRNLPLLRDGLPENALADLGRPLSTDAPQ
ncbi:hypothetical protein ACFWRG_34600 [Micromonospora tulbaghiae]|uniref:Uncharacterized protein n=1 Tax=Streptomyces bacillaris TaxID=68179 RepID=A0ABW6E454_9ACTN|nr:hypothetical protein [Streptomyces nanshensis]